MLATAVLCAALAAAPGEASALRVEPPPDYLIQGAVAAGAGIIGVPVAYYAARFVGTLSNQLLFALVPSLLVLGFLPPLIVSVTSWLMRNAQRGEGEASPRFLVPFLVTTAVNIAMMVLGGFLGVSLANAGAIAAMSLLDAAAMAAGSVGTMRALGPPAAATPAPQAMAQWAPLSTVAF